VKQDAQLGEHQKTLHGGERRVAEYVSTDDLHGPIAVHEHPLQRSRRSFANEHDGAEHVRDEVDDECADRHRVRSDIEELRAQRVEKDAKQIDDDERRGQRQREKAPVAHELAQNALRHRADPRERPRHSLAVMSASTIASSVSCSSSIRVTAGSS